MNDENLPRKSREGDLLGAEEQVRERRDRAGQLWRKVYVGGGAHLENWLAQCRELAGEENVELEVIDSGGLACFEPAGQELCRIWVRAGAAGELNRE